MYQTKRMEAYRLNARTKDYYTQPRHVENAWNAVNRNKDNGWLE